MGFLSIDKLCKSYGDFQAAKDVAVAVPKGAVCTLLGPSGCGKTTTLRCIAGLEVADKGEISLDGRVLSAPAQDAFVQPEKRNLGMVFQSYALWPHKSVFDNLALGLRVAGKSRGEIRNKVDEVLAVVGMKGRADRFPAQLSGGQQQRVAVARALALEPKCLLFDEPLSNLDVLLRDRMRFEIREILTRLGITAVYVTHDQTEAMIISDSVCVMNEGRVVQQGRAAELYDRPASRFVAEFFGRTNLLPIDLNASDPEKGIFKTQSGLKLQSRDAMRLDQGHAGTIIAVRPEAIEITDSPEGDTVLAVVRACVHTGPNTNIEIDAGDQRMSVLVSGRRDYSLGAKVGLIIKPDDIMLINDD